MQISRGGTATTPVCRTDEDRDEEYCCLKTGVVCNGHGECCPHEKCVDEFGGTDGSPKRCTQNCGATGSSCGSESQCCGAGEVNNACFYCFCTHKSNQQTEIMVHAKNRIYTNLYSKFCNLAKIHKNTSQHYNFERMKCVLYLEYKIHNLFSHVSRKFASLTLSHVYSVWIPAGSRLQGCSMLQERWAVLQ